MMILAGIWLMALLATMMVLGWVLFVVNRARFEWEAPSPAPDEVRGEVARTTLMIPTPSGDRIEGWLYRPAGPPAPMVIMAPGLCGTKEGPLERFAWGFAAAGFSVLAFDFRSFGGSEGRLRHSIDLRAHVTDYAAVIAHVRAGGVPGVDAARIALWGTSFSGASATCAAKDNAVEALVLHVPYLGRPGSTPGAVQMIGYVGLSFAEIAGDALARLVGVRLPPAYITAYCLPGEHAFAPSRDCTSRGHGASAHPFWSSLPEVYRGGWRNLMLVRDLQHLSAIDPEAALKGLTCPVLAIAARRDDMIRIDDTRAICAANPGARVHEFDVGHFDPYVDPWFPGNFALQAAFLRESLISPLPWPALEGSAAQA